MGVREAYLGRLDVAAYLIGVAAVFDFLDGFVARALRVHSPIGKELDSLADMVTFGVLPGAIAFVLLGRAGAGAEGLVAGVPLGWAHVAFMIPICSALRLANFNIDERQTDQFIGLPTPANALFWASLPLILAGGSAGPPVWFTPWVLAVAVVVMSLLLVAELPLFALKFKSYRPADNWLRYGFLVLSLVLIFVFSFLAVPLIILLYVLLSVLQRILPNP